jgi:uncharacterized membrane protein
MTIPDVLRLTIAFLCALGSGLIGGVFFAFSTFIMRALARLPASQGVAAMQRINLDVINPLFLAPFLGTAVVSACAILGALMGWSEPRAPFLLAGGALYLVGTFLVTIGFNVPLNDALAPLHPGHPDTEPRWRHYVRRWSLWNHVRTAAALLGAGSCTIAIGV